jgi:hypothetical protein
MDWNNVRGLMALSLEHHVFCQLSSSEVLLSTLGYHCVANLRIRSRSISNVVFLKYVVSCILA